MQNNWKKSIWGLRKKKINLEQNVKTLEEVKMLSANSYPLVVTLSEEDLVAFEEGTLDFPHQDYYRKLELPNKDSSISYVVLNSEKIEQDFFNGIIYLDSIKMFDGTERFIQNVCHSVNRTLTYIGVIPKRKLFIGEGEIDFLSLQDLSKQAINNYEKENRKHKVLSQKEIDEIHERGNLTPLEKAQEWNSLGLCAPGDYASGAKERCRQFGNCMDCLIDYAYSQDEYSSVYDDLKVVNSHKDGILHQEEEAVKKIGAKHE